MTWRATNRLTCVKQTLLAALAALTVGACSRQPHDFAATQWRTIPNSNRAWHTIDPNSAREIEPGIYAYYDRVARLDTTNRYIVWSTEINCRSLYERSMAAWQVDSLGTIVAHG